MPTLADEPLRAVSRSSDPASSACPACGSRRSKAGAGRAGLTVLVCLDCASARLGPGRRAHDPEALYAESYFSGWAMSPGSPAWNQRSATAARRLRHLLRAGARGRLLDVGCAGGYLVAEANSLGFDARGIDVSQHAIAVAESVAPGRVMQGNVEEARYEIGSFGAITLFDVLEHHHRPADLLGVLFGLLERGGWLAATVPDVDSLSHAWMGRFWPHYKEEHVWYPSRIGLRRLLETVGFEVTWEGAAQKCLSIAFMAPLLRSYPVPLLTPLATLIEKSLPRRLAEATFTVSIGERLVFCRKP